MKLNGISDKGLRRIAQGFPTFDNTDASGYQRSELSKFSLEDLQSKVEEIQEILTSCIASITYYEWNAPKYIDPEDRIVVPDGVLDLFSQCEEDLYEVRKRLEDA